jgi:1,2-diacylglycerol-3-alpha-glucose alpha-1,2-galactosyltransferase
MKRLRINMVSESDVSVQGHGVHTAYVEMASALEKNNRVDVIRGEFGRKVDCDIVHIHTVGPRTWRKLFQKGPKKVISAHVVPDSFVGSLALARLWKPMAGWYLRFFYNRADTVLAVSEQTKRELEQLGVKAPIEVVHNFIDTSRYKQTADPDAVRSELGVKKSDFVVIGAGQVQPRKRVDIFLQAAEALPDVTFIWVGGMPFGNLAADNVAMKRLMDSGLSNLHFPGIVPLEKMASYYQMADIFMFPSEQETFGLVIVEAAAAGLPVVLRDIPDYNDTFKDDALRCESDEAFIDAVKKLKSDTALRTKYQQRAQKIAQRYSSDTAIEHLVKIYSSLVKT